ncbi:SGNH/GDSL hydrolase family protein [Luteolibacter sp. LG18]|uniref:SGNH/GDSL hydrolase family protein n=1 Tax=Luteolibacter sp. LG18 TaxID=2819286 RepID=UPI002B29BB3C|nr:hypothetical protein llg_23550 [Luteolibacter sp. LG18]
MKFFRAPEHPVIRDFWRGLTTPSAGVLKMAAVLLLLLLVALTIQARHFRHQVEAGEIQWQGFSDDYTRSSILAVRGARLETTPDTPALVFVGPSALRCWLPHPDDAGAIASAAVGRPVRTLSLCGNKQSPAMTAALVERFGAGFDGWFVLGVNRQSLGREPSTADREFHGKESRVLGFESGVLREDAVWFGNPQEPRTGWDLWDHRAFYLQAKLGLAPSIQGPNAYNPFFATSSIDTGTVHAGVNRLDAACLDHHLKWLERMVTRLRASGPARVALVETPWVDPFMADMHTPAWQEDEATYQRAMREWSQLHAVPWIQSPMEFQATPADFADSRHIGADRLRREFLETVTRQLLSR